MYQRLIAFNTIKLCLYTICVVFKIRLCNTDTLYNRAQRESHAKITF